MRTLMQMNYSQFDVDFIRSSALEVISLARGTLFCAEKMEPIDPEQALNCRFPEAMPGINWMEKLRLAA